MAAHPRWWLRAVAIAIAAASLLATGWQLAGVTSGSVATRVMFTAVVAIYLVVGVLLAERRRGNRIGLVVLVMGILMGGYLILDAFVYGAGDAHGAAIAAWLVTVIDGPLFLLVSLLFLLFPDGRLSSPRWRWLILVDVALVAVVFVWAAFRPGPLTYYTQFENPFGRSDAPLEAIGPVAYLLLLVSVALSALTLIGRWRRAGPLERAQLKWVASAAGFAALVMGGYGILYGPGQFNEVFDALVGLAFGFFPVAIGIAILRYRLFEIDRIVSRTIAYGLIIGLLVVTYTAAILVLQGPLGAVFGGDTISVALSTLVVAALFQPLRARMKRIVDHRFDRARFDGERTAAAFSERLRDEVDIATVTADLDGTVRSTLKPATLGLWLRGAPE